MPFFTYPVDPTGWLLPLARFVLSVNYPIFKFLMVIAPLGIPVVVAIVFALFSMNLMKPTEA